MKKILLLIDGENFRYKVKETIADNGKKFKFKDYSNFDFIGLFENKLKGSGGLDLVDKRYYAAKIHFHKQTAKQSKELIESQRKLKKNLSKNLFTFVTAGHVRAHFGKGKSVVFSEKGVDVKIAVDMISEACDKNVDTIILCSSDSDLQPAVKECIKRGIEVIYLGFSNNPNKGLIYTCSKAMFLDPIEIVSAYNLV